MLTAEQILQDIKTDKVKKVIIDGDFSAECDDQYTLAYALGCEKVEVVGVNASAHFDDKYVDTHSTMLKSYAEMLRVLHASARKNWQKWRKTLVLQAVAVVVS